MTRWPASSSTQQTWARQSQNYSYQCNADRDRSPANNKYKNRVHTCLLPPVASRTHAWIWMDLLGQGRLILSWCSLGLDQRPELGLPEHGDALAGPQHGVFACAAGLALDAGPLRLCPRRLMGPRQRLRLRCGGLRRRRFQRAVLLHRWWKGGLVAWSLYVDQRRSRGWGTRAKRRCCWDCLLQWWRREGVASCEFISGVFLRRKASSGRAGEEEEGRQSLEQGQRKGKR